MCAAAFCRESMIPSKWYCGSGLWYGSQTVSSLNTTFPSMTAATFRSLPPRSNPMRQPSRWRPSGRVTERAGVDDGDRMVEDFLADEVRIDSAGRRAAVVRRALSRRRARDGQEPARLE